MLGKKRSGLLFVFFFCLFLSSCDQEVNFSRTENGEKENRYEIYYMNTSETKIQGVSYTAEAVETVPLIEELLHKLSTPSEELGLRQAIPDDISVVSVSFVEGTVNIHFGESYHLLNGVTEVLRRAAVVKTLCQISGVEFVKYTVGEQPLLYSDMTPVGNMKADDFIDNTSGETTYYQTVHLTLYYTDESGKKLFPARHHVEFDGTISMENLILRQLIQGPLDDEENRKPVIPQGTKVNKVSSKDGICYVDFNKEFLNGIDGVSNSVIIYSIVNSLSEIGNVTKVLFTVDGEQISLYREEIPIDIPLERKLEVIESN